MDNSTSGGLPEKKVAMAAPKKKAAPVRKPRAKKVVVAKPATTVAEKTVPAVPAPAVAYTPIPSYPHQILWSSKGEYSLGQQRVANPSPAAAKQSWWKKLFGVK